MAFDSSTNKMNAIILAAGTSSRFGPENKLLHLFNDKPVIDYAYSQINPFFKKVHFVIGHEGNLIRNHFLGNDNIDFIENPEFLDGLGSSLKAAIRFCLADKACTSALIHLADMPMIRPDHISNLFESFRRQPDNVCISKNQSYTSPPLIIPRTLFLSFIDNLQPDGAKAWIKTQNLTTVPLNDLCFDIDRKADLHR